MEDHVVLVNWKVKNKTLHFCWFRRIGSGSNICKQELANLTPWGRVLLEELTVPQTVKLSKFYQTQIFSNEFTGAHHLSLSCARLIQSTPSHPFSLSSVLILLYLCLGLPSDSFLQLYHQHQYASLLSCIHDICLAPLILLDLVTW